MQGFSTQIDFEEQNWKASVLQGKASGTPLAPATSFYSRKDYFEIFLGDLEKDLFLELAGLEVAKE